MAVQDKTGKINVDTLQEICFQFRVPLEQDMLEMLIKWCRVEEQPGLVQYPLFIHFINWKTTAPSDKLNSTTIGSIPSLQLASKLAGTKLVHQSPDQTADAGKDQPAASGTTAADQAGSDDGQQTARQAPLLVCTPGDSYRTSSQTIGATVGGISNTNYPTCGVPTIRSDKAAPRIKRVSDNTVS